MRAPFQPAPPSEVASGGERLDGDGERFEPFGDGDVSKRSGESASAARPPKLRRDDKGPMADALFERRK
jgi:hypothetical protein